MEKNVLPLADRFAAALPANLTEAEVNALASKELGGDCKIDHISISIFAKGVENDAGAEEMAAAKRMLAWIQGPGAPYFKALTGSEAGYEDPEIDPTAYVHGNESEVSIDLFPKTDSGHSLIPHVFMEMVGEGSWFSIERFATLDGEEHVTSFDSRESGD